MIEYVETKTTGTGTAGIRVSFQIDPNQRVILRATSILIIKTTSMQNCVMVEDTGDNIHRRRRLYTTKSPPPKTLQSLLLSISFSISCV